MAKNTAPKKKRIIRKEVTVSDIFVSVIVAIRDDTSDNVDISGYLHDLNDLLYRHYSNYEVLIVDNALDGNMAETITNLLSTLPCMRLIRLSRRYSHDTAITSGVEASIGDFTVITDPVIDDIKNIPKIITMNLESDIVQGVAVGGVRRRPIRAGLMRRIFYWYSRVYMHIDVPTNSTYFIALSRRAIGAITAASQTNNHLRQAVATVGYRYTMYPYETLVNPIQKRRLKVGALEALDIVSSYSIHPLRFMSWLGFFASIVSFGYGLYVLYVAITYKHVAEGWTTMSLQISGLFFILFLILIVLVEYIGKLLLESRRSVRYNVLDELSSTIAITDTDRRNITD